MSATAQYPAHFESDVVLRNGRTLHVRPVRPDDRDRLLAFYTGLSRDSLYMRFFDIRTPDAALRDSPTSVDYEGEFGVIGELGGDMAGIAHYFRSRKYPQMAEVAFAIADYAQGCGIGTRLLEKLVEVARTKKIEMFRAEVLPDNQKMLDVFLCSGFNVASRTAEGAVMVSFPIRQTDAFDEAVAERSQKAAYASMKSIFAPKSIAVIGASRRRGQLGAEILYNLGANGFQGMLYAVNPQAKEIEGVAAFPTIKEIAEPIDLAIIVVPREDVEQVVDDCISKNVGAIVVITAGFGDAGPEGKQFEQRLLDRVRAAGIRMVGPNCMGVLNTDPLVSMHATFSPLGPRQGNVAMSSQSGALGLAILDYARSLNIGFSTFISVGNKADVSGNDLIQYWAEDPNTDVMMLYLESFGNPRKFGQIARRVARKKPIIAVKAGRSTGSARAMSPQGGALATSDAIVDDLFRQSGVIRTETLEEMFDIGAVLASQPLPLGRRVAILTSAGGPGTLASDACAANGLELATLSESTVAGLRELLSPESNLANPIDMAGQVRAEDYRSALRLIADDPSVDSILVIYIPVRATDAGDVSAVIREAAGETHGKTIVATFMSAQGNPATLMPVPSFPFPERAASALARATAYAEWRRRPTGTVRTFEDIDREVVRAIVERKLAAGGGWLDALETQSLLVGAAIPAVASEYAATVYDAVGASMRIGFPAVLKAQGPTIVHKTESGAVRLGLQDEREVREAYMEMQGRLGDQMTGAIIQQMIPGGVEVTVGAVADPTFGHIVLYGAGGTFVELLSDVAFRIHPLTDTDIADMVREVRWSKLLSGYRGTPPSDVDALETIVARISALLEICPEIRELDINPVKVLQQGAFAVDARIRIDAITPGPPSRRIAY